MTTFAVITYTDPVPSKNLIFILSVILFLSCEKDKNAVQPDTPIPVDTTVRLSKAYYYNIADTTGVPANTDSICYNEKNQIEKIIYQPGADALVFSYNDDGNLMKVSNVSAIAAKKQTYYLHYNLNKKVDTLTVADSSEVAPFMFKSRLSYDPAGNLVNIFTNFSSDGHEGGYANISYSRSTKLDSIQSVYIDKGSINILYTAPDPSGARGHLNVDKAYLFTMAVRSYKFLIHPMVVNNYMQQFLNQDDAIMNNGRINVSEAGATNSTSFTNKFSFNSNGTLRNHQYTEINSSSALWMTYRFEYARK